MATDEYRSATAAKRKRDMVRLARPIWCLPCEVVLAPWRLALHPPHERRGIFEWRVLPMAAWYARRSSAMANRRGRVYGMAARSSASSDQ